MPNKYRCDESGCSYQTDSKRGLGVHKATHKDEIFRTLECSECGEEFEKRTKDIERSDRNNLNHFCSVKCKNNFERGGGIDTECSWCGNEIYIPPSRAFEMGEYELINHFCDKNCESEWKGSNWVGKEHPSWNGGNVDVSCDNCGDKYTVKPSEVDVSSFCSKECKLDAWETDAVTKECEVCKNTIERKPYQFKGDDSVCSLECFSVYMSNQKKGEKNPMYKGGRTLLYGPNWAQRREVVLEKFNKECWYCGEKREEHLQRRDMDLHLHHIIPRDEFVENGEYDYERGNRVDNLVPLCHSHHSMWEGVEIRPPMKDIEYPEVLNSRIA